MSGDQQRSTRWWGRPAAVARHPVLLVLLLAPFLGEGLSGSTPPLDLVLPWNLAFMAALYGCGALVCREVAVRLGLGGVGLAVLGSAYGVWEEGLVDRYWFFPAFWQQSGIGDYSVVWHTNVLLAVHLTAFHSAISVCASVLVVERLAPDRQGRPWTGRWGLAVPAAVLALTPLVYGELDRRPPWPVLGATAGLLLLLISAATALRRRPRRVRSRRAASPRRGVATVAFVAVLAHWVTTYGIATTTVPWPLGVLLSSAPIGIGAVLVARLTSGGPCGADGARVVAGLVAFFSLLDLVVGLGGRYDLALSGLATGAWAAVVARRHRPRAQPQPSS